MTNTQDEAQYRLEQAIAWHLANNFIPPQPPELLEYALEALDACKAGDNERVITFPGGVTVTAGELVENLRIDDLITGRY